MTMTLIAGCKSPRAARELDITLHQLRGLLRYRDMVAPQKDESGDYVWTPEDLDRARQALAARAARRRGA